MLKYRLETPFSLANWLDPFRHFTSVDCAEKIFLNSHCPYYDANHIRISQDRLQFETQVGQYAMIDAELRLFVYNICPFSRSLTLSVRFSDNNFKRVYQLFINHLQLIPTQYLSHRLNDSTPAFFIQPSDSTSHVAYVIDPSVD